MDAPTYLKVSETRHTGTGNELTVTTTYHTDAHDQAAFNNPATISRSDGQKLRQAYKEEANN